MESLDSTISYQVYISFRVPAAIVSEKVKSKNSLLHISFLVSEQEISRLDLACIEIVQDIVPH